MQTKTSLLTIRSVALVLAGLLVCVGGCAEGRFGSELRAKPKPQLIRDAESVTLRVPQDEPFSLSLTEESEQPGLDGTAEAEAVAAEGGTATATAAVTQSGAAAGLFQLGHGFRNDTDRQIDLDVALKFDYAVKVTVDPDAGFPDGSVGLKLYARDGHGRLLRDVTLLHQTTESGPAERTAKETVHVKLTLGPADSVNIFLAGQTRVDIRQERAASGLLELRAVQMEIRVESAPAVQP